MYPASTSNDYQKPAAPPVPTPYDQPPVTGIPVVPPPSTYNYADQSHPNPANQHQIQANTPSGSVGKWSTGLCDCCSDCSVCCMTCLCPCVTFGQVAEIVDRGSPPCVVSAGLYGMICYLSGCACIYSSFYRTKMRKRYMLPERPGADFLVHFCCECCALCQEYRHLKDQGFDLSIGWRGNMEKQNHGMTMSPIVPHVMNR